MCSAAASGRMPVLCLGEALVDLICERPVGSVHEARAFVPHLGGAIANVALLAARAGARTMLAGGAGDDDWGHWLRLQLASAGVDVGRFELIEGLSTPLALVTIDAAGEASYAIYGEAIATVVAALDGVVREAVAASAALFISSNTLVRERERAITETAREVALEHGLPVIFDPNLRLHRWRSTADAVEAARRCVPGALLVRCNALEARLLSGEQDLGRAAGALLAAGATNVVVSDGRHGALARGQVELEVGGISVRVRSTIGAGDALTATLIAGLQDGNWLPAALEPALRAGVVAATAACERWGACD